MIQKLTIPNLDEQLGEKSARVETGPLQVNEDWPGTFIRGDTSFHFASSIRQLLEMMDPEEKKKLQWFVSHVEGLAQILESSRI